MLCVILLFCASIVQGSGASVSNVQGEVTRFPLTVSTTYLAHSHLDGKYFHQVDVGDVIVVLDDDPLTESVYDVVEIVHAPANDPFSPHTNLYIDEQWMDPEQAWGRVGYLNPDRLVLQTCIEVGENPAWGRLFVIAVPRR